MVLLHIQGQSKRTSCKVFQGCTGGGAGWDGLGWLASECHHLAEALQPAGPDLSFCQKSLSSLSPSTVATRPRLSVTSCEGFLQNSRPTTGLRLHFKSSQVFAPSSHLFSTIFPQDLWDSLSAFLNCIYMYYTSVSWSKFVQKACTNLTAQKTLHIHQFGLKVRKWLRKLRRKWKCLGGAEIMRLG